jgi:hypothetical protein
MAEPYQDLLFGVCHPIQHLQLETATGHAQLFGDGQPMGQRTNVVAAQRGPQLLVPAHHEPGRALEARVGLPLLLVNGDRPALRASMDRLVVPVGALDQPHPNGSAALASPLGQLP